MSKEKRLSEKARRRVKEEHNFVELNEAQFIWHHEPDENDEWKDQAFVVVPKGMMGEELMPLSSSTGADTDGWPDATSNNPAFVFGSLLFRNWKSDAERIEAIAEFAKIDAADWAREILRRH